MLRYSIRSSLRSRHINWEGATTPLPNPPPRPATGSHHENGPQHSHRKTQRRSPGRSPHLQRPRERTATTDPKEAGGEKGDGDLVRCPDPNRFGDALAPRESKERPPRSAVAQTASSSPIKPVSGTDPALAGRPRPNWFPDPVHRCP